jgi:hypothetical protein
MSSGNPQPLDSEINHESSFFFPRKMAILSNPKQIRQQSEEEPDMKTKIVIIAILCLTTAALAQYPFQASAHFSIATPQNEFADNLDATGFGGGGAFFYHLPESTISFGAGIDFYVYGSETRKEPFSQFAPEVTVDVTRTNSIFQGFLMLRLQPPAAKITPYADGLFGFNYLFTRTSVKSEGWDDDDHEIASSTNYDDGALAYGAGAGLLISVYTHEAGMDPEDRDVNLAIDLGFRYLKGGEASYLKKGDIEIDENNKVIYHPNNSFTDLITINIGVNVMF